MGLPAHREGVYFPHAHRCQQGQPRAQRGCVPSAVRALCAQRGCAAMWARCSAAAVRGFASLCFVMTF